MKTLAEATGTTGNTIWRIENGRANPSWELAIKIAKYLGCSLDVFKPTVVSAQDDKENNPGFQLYLLRKKAGYKSQTALAKAIGVSRITISDWERDKYYPQGNNLINLAKVLKVSTSYLFSILLPSANQHHNKFDTEQLPNGPFFVTKGEVLEPKYGQTNQHELCAKQLDLYEKIVNAKKDNPFSVAIYDKYICFNNGDCVRSDAIASSHIFDSKTGKEFIVFLYSSKSIDAHPIQMPKRAFKIVFENGDVIRAGGEHLWTVSIRERKKTYSDMEILPTERIYEISLDGSHRAVIPRVKAVEYADKKLILDPYILGAWLGDGHSHTNRITSMDSEIIDRFKNWANQFYAGEVVPCKQSNSGKATTYKIINTPFREMLKDLKCLKDTRYDDTKNNEKHIPEEYFTASKAQRLELLRGLMDTDGCRYKFKGKLSASAVYCTSSEKLRDDVCRLIDSLGGIAKITHTTPCEKTSGRHYKTHWHISFTMKECPFYIKRKAYKWNPGKCADRNHIVYIEEIDVEPMRCLSVAAADRMYCCGKHFTVTRNTATGITKIMNASAQRIELIARIMAETGIKPLYQKLLQLDQQFIDQTMVIRVFNQPLQISPDDLAGNFDVTVDVGGATGKDEQRAQQMMMLIQYAANLMQLGVMRPENVYQICQQLMMVWGWKDYDRYLTNPQEADKLKQCLQIINQLNQNAQMAAKQGQQIPTQPIVQAFQQIYQLIDQVVGAHAQQNMSMTGSPSNEQMAAIGGGNNAGQYSATAIQGRSANGVVPGAA